MHYLIGNVQQLAFGQKQKDTIYYHLAYIFGVIIM